MTRDLKAADAPALWTRVAALLCMLVTLGLVIPQACHTHLRLGLSSRHSTVQAADRSDDALPEGSCSLCVALQTAPPTKPVQLAQVVLYATGVPERRADVHVAGVLPFSLQSRPPPANDPA